MGFCTTHIRGYSQLLSSLNRVTRKKNYFDRRPEQQQALQHINQEIAHVVALGLIRAAPAVQNVVYTAAREHGLTWHLWRNTPG